MTAVAVRLLCLVVNGHFARRNVRPLLTMHFTAEKKCTKTRILFVAHCVNLEMSAEKTTANIVGHGCKRGK